MTEEQAAEEFDESVTNAHNKLAQVGYNYRSRTDYYNEVNDAWNLYDQRVNFNIS
jgi:hypothetical protein